MKHLELFSGIGGFRMAMHYIEADGLIGFENIAFSEIDPSANRTYAANYDTSGEIEIGDISSFTANSNNIRNLPNFNFLTAGFPCQSFSMMGNQEGFKDNRGQLFFRIMDVVRVKKPKYLLLENVKNLYTHDKRRTFRRIIQELKDQGYYIFHDIFNSADFGLPQTRNRVVIFATLEEVPLNFTFSSDEVRAHFQRCRKDMSISQFETVLDILEKEVPQKYYLSERIKPTILSDGSGGFKSKSDINQLIARPLTASMHKMHRACQDNYYSTDFIESNGLINPVLTHTKEELAQLPIRKLTPSEAMMLQGFPADFAEKASRLGVSNGALYKQAGNAVSVNTIYSILHYLITNRVLYADPTN